MADGNRHRYLTVTLTNSMIPKVAEINDSHEIIYCHPLFHLYGEGREVSGNIPPEVISAAGQPLTVAKVVSSLSNNNNLTIKQLSKDSGLSISQVSSGLKQCRYRGWVLSTQGAVQGKGRPRHLWGLKVSPLELIRELETEAKTKHMILAKAVKRLRDELEN